VRYEWQDGKIVKSINQDAIAALGDQTFKRGRSGIWWWVGGLVLLTAMAALVWYWRRPR
jgi:hypothetical protein